MSLETRQEVDGEKDGEKDFLSSRPRPGERWTEAVTKVGVFPACISRTNPPLLSVVSTATSEPPSFPAAAMGTTSPAWTGLLLLCLTSCNVSCRKTDLRSALTVKVGCLQFVKCFFFFFSFFPQIQSGVRAWRSPSSSLSKERRRSRSTAATTTWQAPWCSWCGSNRKRTDGWRGSGRSTARVGRSWTLNFQKMSRLPLRWQETRLWSSTHRRPQPCITALHVHSEEPRFEPLTKTLSQILNIYCILHLE